MTRNNRRTVLCIEVVERQRSLSERVRSIMLIGKKAVVETYVTDYAPIRNCAIDV